MADVALPDPPRQAKRNAHDTVGSRARPLNRLVHRLVVWCAVAYLLALVGVWAAFRLIGEQMWLTTTALYLPRIGWAVPLPFIVIALVLTRSYRILITQVAAAWVVLFPLMGLCLQGPGTATPGRSKFRVFTLNIGQAPGGPDEVLTRIHEAHADIVVLEEVVRENVPFLRAALPDYSFEHLGQFVIASRFPMDEPFDPPLMEVEGQPHSRHYARCRVHTPDGPIRVYATHPVSPRGPIDRVRERGLKEEVLKGRVLQADARAGVAANAHLRVTQVRALAEDAAGSPDPVLIAGDTNLPGQSWALGHWLGSYQDAFAEAGRGFGYTYPAHKWAWMRIDRILGSARLRFLNAAPVTPRVYKHFGFLAEVELRPAKQ